MATASSHRCSATSTSSSPMSVGSAAGSPAEPFRGRRPQAEGPAGEADRRVDGGQRVLWLAIPEALHQHVLRHHLATGEPGWRESPLVHAAEHRSGELTALVLDRQ